MKSPEKPENGALKRKNIAIKRITTQYRHVENLSTPLLSYRGFVIDMCDWWLREPVGIELTTIWHLIFE